MVAIAEPKTQARPVHPPPRTGKPMARRNRAVTSGYRYYQPETGRWIRRDPLYRFAAVAWRQDISRPVDLRAADNSARRRFEEMTKEVGRIPKETKQLETLAQNAVKTAIVDVDAEIARLATWATEDNTYTFVANEGPQRVDPQGLRGICLYHFDPVKKFIIVPPGNPDLPPSLEGPCDYKNPAILDWNMCFCGQVCPGITRAPPTGMHAAKLPGGGIGAVYCPPYYMIRMCKKPTKPKPKRPPYDYHKTWW